MCARACVCVEEAECHVRCNMINVHVGYKDKVSVRSDRMRAHVG